MTLKDLMDAAGAPSQRPAAPLPSMAGNLTLWERVHAVAQHAQAGLALSVYQPETLSAIFGLLESYLAGPPPEPKRRGWWPWGRAEEGRQRVAPLLLSGPVGTGKTTLMMLMDRAVPEASCAPLFQQEIRGHPSTATQGGEPIEIEVHPLALMGEHHNIPTGVVRLRELQTFHRLYTYDRDRATTDAEAAEHFAQFFAGRIVFIDEFVPDTVTSFPMQVINHLADHGVLVVLSSNRRETPFVEGVTVVAVDGADMRVGDLRKVCLPAGPDRRFDAFNGVAPSTFDRVARGLRGPVMQARGQRWLRLDYPEVAPVPADLLAFQHLLHFTHGVLVDRVPLFDPQLAGGDDGARRFVFLIDALYDERRPVLVRLTNPTPLPNDFDVETLRRHYLPETLLDLERALSRLRQLSALV